MRKFKSILTSALLAAPALFAQAKPTVDFGLMTWPEVKQALTELLTALDSPLIESEYDLRRHRAMLVLERIASPESARVLQEIVEKSPSSREKREAAAALRRNESTREAPR